MLDLLVDDLGELVLDPEGALALRVARPLDQHVVELGRHADVLLAVVLHVAVPRDPRVDADLLGPGRVLALHLAEAVAPGFELVVADEAARQRRLAPRLQVPLAHPEVHVLDVPEEEP